MVQNYINIKCIPREITVTEYIVTFEYYTWKSHERREDKRRIKAMSDFESVKSKFMRWAEKNITMVNVSILAIEKIEGSTQKIVL